MLKLYNNSKVWGKHRGPVGQDSLSVAELRNVYLNTQFGHRGEDKSKLKNKHILKDWRTPCSLCPPMSQSEIWLTALKCCLRNHYYISLQQLLVLQTYLATLCRESLVFFSTVSDKKNMLGRSLNCCRANQNNLISLSVRGVLSFEPLMWRFNQSLLH